MLIVCIAAAFWGVVYISAFADVSQPDIVSVTDNFEDGTQLSNLNMLEYSNVIKDQHAGNADYGLVPAFVWSDPASISTGYVVYKLSAEDGYVLNNLQAEIKVRFGHGKIDEQYATSDIKVAVSANNRIYTDVYSMRSDTEICADGEDTPKGLITEDVKRYTISLDLSGNAVIAGRTDIYVKIILVAPDYQGVPLGNVANTLHNVMLTAGQEVAPENNDININSDFTLGGTVASYSNIVDYNNVTKDTVNGNATFALIPANVWGASVNASTGYITYNIAADNDMVIEQAELSMVVRFFAANSDFEDGYANFIVSVSSDNKVFTDVFNLYDEKGIGKSSDRQTINVDLTDFTRNHAAVFVRITMVCPDKSSLVLQSIPTCLISSSFVVAQRELSPDAVVIGNNFAGAGEISAFDGVVAHSGLTKYSNGNATFALVPGSVWGNPVNVETEDIHLVYRISAGDSRMFGNLRMGMGYKLKNGANIAIYTSYDGETYTEFINLFNLYGTRAYSNSLQALDIDFKGLAENARDFYVKVDFTHPTGQYNLDNLLLNVFDITFEGDTKDYSADVGTILYYLNGGSYNGTGNPSSYTAGSGNITLEAPARQYMEFAGWYDNPGFEGDAVTHISTSEIKAYRLYAKWEAFVFEINIIINGTGTGTLTVSGTPFTSSAVINRSVGTGVEFVLTPGNGSIIYGLNVDGKDVFLTSGNYYKIANVKKPYTITATFNERAVQNGGFSMDYTDNVKYGNNWKEGLYDYSNLYITDDNYHSLGIDNGEGYITYKFETADGRYFESAALNTRAKLFDFFGREQFEKVDYYISYDNQDYHLIYKSVLTRRGDNFQTIEQNLTQHIIGRQSFYLKVAIGSNSTNWTLFQALSIEFTYEVIELILDYGGYTDVVYTQYKGLPIDKSAVSIREGYIIKSEKIYLDADYTQELSDTDIISDNMTLYIKSERLGDGMVTYVLNGGSNNAANADYYISEQGLALYEPQRDNYIFAGWYFDEGFTLLATEVAKGRTGNITFYAKWVPASPLTLDKWEITYVLNGGTNPEANAPYVYEDEQFTLADASKDGWIFKGWQDADGNKYTAADGSKLSSGLTLYAVWEQAAQPGEPSGCGCSSQIGMRTIIGFTAAALAAVLFVVLRGKSGKERN